MQQAAAGQRLSRVPAYGPTDRFSPTPQLFTTPAIERTEAYITGRFG